MGPKKLTDYERQRLENIRRNEEMMAALKLHSKASALSSASKRQRTETKSYKLSSEKKPKTETPFVIRRSLRTRSVAPEKEPKTETPVGIRRRSVRFRGSRPDYSEKVKDGLVDSESEPSPSQSLTLNMKDAYRGTDSDQALIDTIVSVSKKSQMGFINESSDDVKLSGLVDEIDGGSCNLIDGVSGHERSDCVVKREGNRLMGSVDLRSLSLQPENIARVMPGRILSVKFFPSNDMNMIVAGNKFGDVAFWNVDSGKDDGDGIYLYHPHSAPVSGISIQPFALSKIFTSCYDGFIRLMDAEKEVFDLLYSSDEAIFSLSHNPNDMKCLYFGEGHGGLNIWDERAGSCSNSWILHKDRINSVDFNSKNPNIMATSSTDGTACIWDLRSIDADKPKTLMTVNHKKAVHSAYFSPSGSYIATTSMDDTVGILNGVNYEDMSMIKHGNQTGRWISSFRGIWGWDDSHVFIGNMNRAIDVLSPAKRKTVMTLQSEHVSAISCRFDIHPYKVGMLAGATSGGQIYLWTSS